MLSGLGYKTLGKLVDKEIRKVSPAKEKDWSKKPITFFKIKEWSEKKNPDEQVAEKRGNVSMGLDGRVKPQMRI